MILRKPNVQVPLGVAAPPLPRIAPFVTIALPETVRLLSRLTAALPVENVPLVTVKFPPTRMLSVNKILSVELTIILLNADAPVRVPSIIPYWLAPGLANITVPPFALKLPRLYHA